MTYTFTLPGTPAQHGRMALTRITQDMFRDFREMFLPFDPIGSCFAFFFSLLSDFGASACLAIACAMTCCPNSFPAIGWTEIMRVSQGINISNIHTLNMFNMNGMNMKHELKIQKLSPRVTRQSHVFFRYIDIGMLENANRNLTTAQGHQVIIPGLSLPMT